jgi:hypothetical protein
MREGSNVSLVCVVALLALVVPASAAGGPRRTQDAGAADPQDSDSAASQDGAPAASQDDTVVVVGLRVTAWYGERRVGVDRGRSDGIAVGDVVWLTLRTGGLVRADVVAVEERSATIEVLPGELAPSPGTRGEVRVPSARFAAPVAEVIEGAEGAEGAASGTGADTPARASDDAARPPVAWRREDEGFSEGMPLLGGIDAVHPSQRTPFLAGRVWVALDGLVASDDGRSNFLARAGTDIAIENAYGQGDLVDIGIEFERYRFDRPELDDRSPTELRLERLSYRVGGTRFDRDRFTVGRFLQAGAPQLGVLDGLEWARQVDEWNAFGASVGFQPEPNPEYDSGHDFQLAGWYRWTSDATEIAAAQVGFQKTFHDGAADRDRFFANGHYLPRFGWHWFGALELDVYSAGDDVKGPGLGLTRAYLSASPYTAGRWGLDLTWSYSEFPDVEREELLPAVLPAEIADERIHRLGADLWVPIADDARFVQRLGVWDDADDAGADIESGVEIDGLLGRGSTLRPIFFAASGDFTDVWGTRAWLTFGAERMQFDVFYELANYDQQGFDDQSDNFVQHRLRTSLSYRHSERMSLSTYVDGTSYNDERGVTAGVFAQWTF